MANEKRTTLYITDLDGTLLSPETCITPRSASLINDAIADGALFSVATARTPATLDNILRPLKMQLPAIIMTGGALWTPSTCRFSHPCFFKPQAAKDVIDLYKRLGFSSYIFALNNDVLDVYHTGPMSDYERIYMEERLNSPFKRFHVPADGESELPENLDNIMLFYVMRPNQQAAETFTELQNIKDIHPLTYHDIYGPETAIVEIFPPATSKALAAERLKVATGADRIVAFGDNINDLSLLQVADVAVAMGNAVPEVKEAAHVVIDDNSKDSVARFINEDFRNIRQ